MTIEPPLALNKPTDGTSESMCPEGVAYPTVYPCNAPLQQQNYIAVSQQNNMAISPTNKFIQAMNQSPDTPEQYAPDIVSIKVASPSSSFYEQDVSEMQKSLLSPCSTHMPSLSESVSSQTSIAAMSQAPGLQESMDETKSNMDDYEISFNLERVMNSMTESRCPIKSEPPWSPQVVLDTGQIEKFKAEDVMMSHNVNQGPTLAELNEMDSSFFDDISSIISNDPIIRMNAHESSQLSFEPKTASSTGFQQQEKNFPKKEIDCRNNKPLAISIPPDIAGNNNNSNMVQNMNHIINQGHLSSTQHSPGIPLPKPTTLSPNVNHMSPTGTTTAVLSPTSSHPKIETLLRGGNNVRITSATASIPKKKKVPTATLR